MEGLAHAGRRYEMLELERDLGVLLRQRAALEGVGKLRLSADAEEELRLRNEAEPRHARIRGGGFERGEVHMCGDVLLAGRFVGILAGFVLAVAHQRVEMTAREL